MNKYNILILITIFNFYKNKYVVFPPFPLTILFVRSVPAILSKRNASYLVNNTVTEGSDTDAEDEDDDAQSPSLTPVVLVDKTFSISGYTEACCGGA